MLLKLFALTMAGIGISIAGGFNGEAAFAAMALPCTAAIVYILLGSA